MLPYGIMCDASFFFTVTVTHGHGGHASLTKAVSFFFFFYVLTLLRPYLGMEQNELVYLQENVMLF